MRPYHTLTVLLLFFVFGCDKEDPTPAKTAEEIVKAEVAEALAAESDLSDFSAAFKDLELEPEELSNGITIFAPANGGTSGGRIKGGSTTAELNPGILKSHIIKGLVQAQGLHDGSLLEALDGNQLAVTVNGEEIRINGVLISSRDLVRADKYIIHKVEKIMPNVAMVVTDGEDALNALQASREMTNTLHKTLVMMDGILSDDAACIQGTDWCAIDNFSFKASDAIFMNIWKDGYNTIAQLNVLLRDVPELTFAEKDLVLAEAKGLRAYIYLQLVRYFGSVPIPEGIWLGDSDMNMRKEEVYHFIKSELESIVHILPAVPSENRYVLTADAAKVLLARVSLLNQDYTHTETLTTEVIESLRYQLAGTVDEAFADATNAEIMWDFSFTLPAGFSDYFFGRSFSPAIRLAEVYLMHAEAKLALDQLDAARASLDIIRERRGMSPSVGLTMSDVTDELRETWRVEMNREGNRFTNVVRWDAVPDAMYLKGYDLNRHSVLPVPQSFIDKYPNLMQNPGY